MSFGKQKSTESMILLRRRLNGTPHGEILPHMVCVLF